MICEPDNYVPSQMEVEEVSPSNKKLFDCDYINQSFELSTQNSTQNHIAHNYSMRISNEFEEECEHDPSDFGFSHTRQEDYVLGKLKFAFKTNQLCNTFEEDDTTINAKILEQTSSKETEEEKVNKVDDFYNGNEPVAVTEQPNMVHHALENENVTQMLNSPVQMIQVPLKKGFASEKKGSKRRVKHSVDDDSKITDLNDTQPDLSFPQTHTTARTIPEFASQRHSKSENEDIKRLAAYREHIPLISKAMLKYSLMDEFRQEHERCCQEMGISYSGACTYLKKNVKGKKEGQVTKNGTPLQQAKIANEQDVLNLLEFNGRNDELLGEKCGAILAFEIFFNNGFYEHWIESQYSRFWIKKGTEHANNIKKAFTLYKNDVSFSFLKYKY